MTSRSHLGAVPEDGGTRFRVIAPRANRLDVVLENPGRRATHTPMRRAGDGVFEAFVAGVTAGDRYRIALDGTPFPDPATRSQPDGVHGASCVVDPGAFGWTDRDWRGVPLEGLILYELHVGTFTPEGTFDGVRAKLPWLRDLGITAIELMPLADFPGARNWGYDGAAPFAPARCYGSPDDLRRLVDAAHAAGIAVHLDVVYNHLGPDGAYAAAFHPGVFSERHRSPWGAGINMDGHESEWTRRYLIESALCWITEYHLDGLRLDATQEIVDESARHFLAELGATVRDAAPDREVLLIAEDVRNLARIVTPEPRGWGLDGMWVEDFHHSMRRYLAGDSDGYFSRFAGTAEEIARIIERGWVALTEGATDTDPTGIPPGRFVFFVQNHDQVGNRAMGERLHHAIDSAAWRAAVALLMAAPQAPLLFMGQEWAASTPFRFFTDHAEPLGASVTAGRRAEFAHFESWHSPEAQSRIPDPQDVTTFTASRLDWNETAHEPHAANLRFTRALIALRREHPALAIGPDASHRARAVDPKTIVVERRGPGARGALAVVRLRGAGSVELPGLPKSAHVLLTTEDAAFAPDPAPIRLDPAAGRVTFRRPGALILDVGTA